MDIGRYHDELIEAAREAGFFVSHFGEISGYKLPVLERREADGLPEVYISSGVHGDEPAPPLAVLELLKKRVLPYGANYTIFPIVNPQGLAAGTRENAAGVDLNRDYGPAPVATETRAQVAWIGDRQFDFTLCLHEDSDGEGFYLYSHVRDRDAPDYPALAIAAAEPFTGIDQRTEIDEMPAKDGRMFPPEDIMDRSRFDLPEALRLLWRHGARVSITTETPSSQPISARIAAQCAVVEAVLCAFLSPW